MRKRAMGRLPVLLALAMGGVLAGISPLAAQGPVPKKGSCPSGYNQSGDYCVPGSSSVGPALPRVGGCPTGYNQSGDYCVGSGSSAKPAMVRSGGSCPSGYNQSGNYCVKQ